MNDLTVVIPVKDEPHHIANDIADRLRARGAEVLIIDDGSKCPNDQAIKHHQCKGYGAAIITGIESASRPFILTMDGDGEHTVEQAIKLYTVWNLIDVVDMLIGARRLKNEKLIRLLGRKALNIIASFLALYYFSDLNSGMRIFRRDIALGYAPILCKQFSFTTSLTMSMKCDNYVVECFPIRLGKREAGTSHVKLIKHGLITLGYILWIGLALRTRGLRAWLRMARRSLSI